MVIWQSPIQQPLGDWGKKPMDIHKMCHLVHVITENLPQSDCPLVSIQKACDRFVTCALPKGSIYISLPQISLSPSSNLVLSKSLII